uniref:Uncharacterized protein n=1 Tax=Candidatus Kentrum sp. FM TaxID=2126340 RepID=A0A450SDN4_9GAMM|nr:MAG: hypothetical protein BECKFM1743A_GA0114220_100394 [Candidatus Kentron sp. FM]VFJ50614.1 MAG: hypothetical protein BECKFM1743C_GA0114222_100875 [Candidatus Kentron sp. FM]VFK11580.1 MAG: hypothetical protein BECKFM1743B_GA0114221_101954 [Candidatus Kentron sp. FM]
MIASKTTQCMGFFRWGQPREEGSRNTTKKEILIHEGHSAAEPQPVIVVLSGSLSISLLAIEKAG